MIIQGKEYRKTKCVKCGFEYQVDESCLTGLEKEDIEDLIEMGCNEFKLNDDLCIGCYLDIAEKGGKL